jgi:transposase
MDHAADRRRLALDAPAHRYAMVPFSSTGGRSILGRISKRSSKYLRTLLIQAAKVLLMRPHNWARYSFGPWLNSASERLHRNKLAVCIGQQARAHSLERAAP